jgi:cysteine-rich repeat protein
MAPADLSEGKHQITLTAIDSGGLAASAVVQITIVHAPAPPTCGNGVLDPQEACDDGNVVDGDGCDGDCTVTACGNGIETADEECDDGNVLAEDGCSATCTFEPCRAIPETGCRALGSGKGQLKIKLGDPTKNQLQWKWTKGAATTKTELGNPMTAEQYYLCIYDDGTLISTTTIEAGGFCAGTPCWKETAAGYRFKDKDLTPDGALQLVLKAGADGKAQMQFKGKSSNLDTPAPMSLSGPVVVQLKQASDVACWATTFSAPFKKRTAGSFVDHSD